MDIDETNISTELWFFLLANNQHFDSEKWNKKNKLTLANVSEIEKRRVSLLIRNDDPSDGNRLSDNHKVLTWWNHRVSKCVCKFRIGKKERKIPAIKTNIQSQSHDTHTHTHSFFTLIEIRLLNIPVTLMSNCKVCAHTHLVERNKWNWETKRPTTREKLNNVAVGWWWHDDW